MKNWKTTAVGVGGAILSVVAAWLSGCAVDWHQLIHPMILAALGFLAKDFNVN